jgi:hypothetical protein
MKKKKGNTEGELRCLESRASWGAACCAPTLDFFGHIGTGEKAA